MECLKDFTYVNSLFDYAFNLMFVSEVIVMYLKTKYVQLAVSCVMMAGLSYAFLSIACDM